MRPAQTSKNSIIVWWIVSILSLFCDKDKRFDDPKEVVFRGGDDFCVEFKLSSSKKK